MRRFSRNLPYWLALAALALLSAFLLLDGLGTRPFESWDESRHGQSAFEMLQSGEYVVTTYLGEPDYWNLKPPLSVWADALGFRLFGYNPLGLRIFSAGAMLGTYLLMALFARRRYGRLESLCVLWLFCSCTVAYYMHFARTGQADGFSNVFYLLALMALILSERDARWLYGCAVCFGLSFMARSWHAFLIPLVCFLTLLLTGRLRQLKLRRCAGLVGAGLLPILPWAVWRYSRDGWTFFKGMLEYDLLKRGGEAIEGHAESPLYYFEYLARMPEVMIAAGLCALALIVTLARKRRLGFDQLALLIAAAAPIALFSLAETKIERYSFPTICALLLGGGLSAGRLIKACVSWWKRRRRALAGALAALIVAAAVGTGACVAANVRSIAGLTPYDHYQTALATVLAPDTAAPDGGRLRMYALYENDWSSWRPSDVLLSSICLGRYDGLERADGGLEPFLADPGAWILLAKRYLTPELEARCAVRYSDDYVCVLENAG